MIPKEGNSVRGNNQSNDFFFFLQRDIRVEERD